MVPKIGTMVYFAFKIEKVYGFYKSISGRIAQAF